MNMLKYIPSMSLSKWHNENITKDSIRLNDGDYCIWRTKIDKPIAVMFHGIGGNHYGLNFLAENMSSDYSIILVDLPNHGKSPLKKAYDISSLHDWTNQILQQIELHHGNIDLVVAHSFGCICIANNQTHSKYKTVFINPVNIPSAGYRIFGTLCSGLPYLLGWSQNLLPLAFIKGDLMLRIKTKDTRRRVVWNTLRSISTITQGINQAKMSRISLIDEPLRNSKDRVDLVIICDQDGSAKKVSHEENLDYYGRNKTKLIEINGGHLSPLECPDELAQFIMNHFSKK